MVVVVKKVKIHIMARVRAIEATGKSMMKTVARARPDGIDLPRFQVSLTLRLTEETDVGDTDVSGSDLFMRLMRRC